MSWSHLYTRPRPVDSNVALRRIYAPEAYQVVRDLQIVPIVDTEAMGLASAFPICWVRTEKGATLCALRSLLPDGRGHPVRAIHASETLPQVLRAYPFAMSEGEAAGDVVIDDMPADDPTDIGAPIRMADGRPSIGAVQRVKLIMALRQARIVTDRLGAALLENDWLEPWSLDQVLSESGGSLPIAPLLVVRPQCLEGSSASALWSKFGVRATSLVSLHRLSLFRIGVLVKAAKAANAGSNPEEAAEVAA